MPGESRRLAWPATIDRFSPRVRHVEVDATHLGMGFNPTIWGLIVEALERPMEPGAIRPASEARRSSLVAPGELYGGGTAV